MGMVDQRESLSDVSGRWKQGGFAWDPKYIIGA